MTESLREIFLKYLKNIEEAKGFENLLTDYLQIFKELSEIYECKEYYRVYLDNQMQYCRVVIFIDSKHSGIDFIKKQINIKKEEIYFSKNCIFIERQFSIENFNPIKSIFDLSKIKYEIQEAELNNAK